MTTSRQLQLIQVEYSNGNYQRATELADALILSASDEQELATAWLYKGLSTAPMSTITQQRLTTAVSYFREAQKHQPQPVVLASTAIQLSKWTLRHVKQLQGQYAEDSKRRLDGKRGTVAHSPNEDIGSYAGRELGQALFDIAESPNRERKIAVALGQHFESNHSAAIISTLDYAYSASGESTEVVQVASEVTKVVTSMWAVMPGARSRFVDAFKPLRSRMWSRYGDVTFYSLKDEEKLACPSCGYTFVQGKSGCLFAGLFSSYVESARRGQQLVCATCDHEWTY